MDRREFLKGCAGALAFLSIPRMLIPKASAKEIVVLPKALGTIGPHKKLLEIIAQDFLKYPRGHVARSISDLRIVENEREFGYSLQGLSVSNQGKNHKYFAISIYTVDIFLEDLARRKKFEHDVLSHLELAWKKSHRMWGVA